MSFVRKSRSRKVLAQEDCSRTAGATEFRAPEDPSRILMFRDGTSFRTET
jgi:hypothetical protein